MPPIDPIHALRRRAVAVAGVAGVLVVASVVWAARVPGPSLVATPLGPGVATASAQDPRIDPLRWRVTLWQPLSAEAIVEVVAPHVALNLISIVRQGERFVAAIEAGREGGLQFASVGQIVAGWTVSAVDPAGVDLVQGESRQRLELKR